MKQVAKNIDDMDNSLQEGIIIIITLQQILEAK